MYFPLAELTLKLIVPDVFFGNDTLLAGNVRSPLISCVGSASAHRLVLSAWVFM